MFHIVTRYLNINNDISISYPKTFSIIDISKEIETLINTNEIIPSDEYKKQKILQIIQNDLNAIDPEIIGTIKQQVGDYFDKGE